MTSTSSKFRRLLPLVLLLASGCGGGISVRSSRDPGVDFSKLQTFDWMSAPTEADRSVNDATMLGLVGAELEAHGLKRSNAQPDLLVVVHRTIEGLQETDKWGYDFKNGKIEKYPLQDGTLVVDLITAAGRQSVWQGTASGLFRQDVSQTERREFLAGIVHDMFADFPKQR